MVPTVAFSVTALAAALVSLTGVTSNSSTSVDGDGVTLGGDRAIGGSGTDGDRLVCPGLPYDAPAPSPRPSLLMAKRPPASSVSE